LYPISVNAVAEELVKVVNAVCCLLLV